MTEPTTEVKSRVSTKPKKEKDKKFKRKIVSELLYESYKNTC